MYIFDLDEGKKTRSILKGKISVECSKFIKRRSTLDAAKGFKRKDLTSSFFIYFGLNELSAEMIIFIIFDNS